MESLLHYVWLHKILPLKELLTVDGQTLEVINPGIHNTNAGPDFLDAKVNINGVLWVGNVELHLKSSDWYRHGHDTNPAYDNIILHVASTIDADITRADGTKIPQFQLEVPSYVAANYEHLLKADALPRCREVLPSIPRLLVHNWLNALQIERLEQKTNRIMQRWHDCDCNWETMLFITIARNFGFGINGEAMEQWAFSIPPSAIGKHRNSLFQIEAIFFGQAGLLADEAISEYYRKDAETDDYYQRLKSEYKFLRQKFTLTPIHPSLWKFLRLRPQNFPHVRIAQMAMMYWQQNINFSKVVTSTSIDELHQLLSTNVSDYWKTHYTFASTQSPQIEKNLSPTSKDLIVINSLIPVMFAYGNHRHDSKLCQLAVSFMEKIRPENNRYITQWKEAGVRCENASDTQAIIQLETAYCKNRDCLRCRFGSEYISATPDFLRENRQS